MSLTIFQFGDIVRANKVPQLTLIHEVFINTSPSDFNTYLDQLIESNQKQVFESLLYYMLLFRDSREIQNMLNHETMKPDAVEKLIMYCYGYMSYMGKSPDRILDDILFFLSQDKLLDVIMNTAHISRDYLIVVYILTKFDVKHLDEYFQKSSRSKELIKVFISMPPQIVYEVIYRNVNFFEYIIMLIPVYYGKEMVAPFYEKYQTEIQTMKEIDKSLRAYNKSLEENNSNYGLMVRLSMIIHVMEKVKSSPLSIENYMQSNIFASDFEKRLAYEIQSNPVYVDLFQRLKSSSYFTIAEDTMIF